MVGIIIFNMKRQILFYFSDFRNYNKGNKIKQKFVFKSFLKIN